MLVDQVVVARLGDVDDRERAAGGGRELAREHQRLVDRGPEVGGDQDRTRGDGGEVGLGDPGGRLIIRAPT